LLVSGWGSDFLSKAEFAAGLDDDPRARLRSAEFGTFLHWNLIGRERGHKRLRRIGVGNPLLQDGLGGGVAADSARTQIAW